MYSLLYNTCILV